ncbi:MAG: xanthine dehydrogenase accessory protein XdhC [Silicimonas sp.]|nr:xanthine dehydrogenase accessory protein XdhC [Silicimonas sp.]
MSFELRDITRIAPVARVVVARTRGSVPREVGAAMLVTKGDCLGTIGGGALEHEAIARAREVLQTGVDRLDQVPLGPGLGQCCGGAVTLLTEIWDEARLADVAGVVARSLPGTDGDMPISVSRLLSVARREGRLPEPGIVDGWMVEPVSEPVREIWVWGAGHVGRAIVRALAPLPGLRICWADTDRGRFPAVICAGVEPMIAANPADLVPLSASHSEHIVLTYSHALDLELCHKILSRPFQSLGLIGSATKRARFRSRLSSLGHSAAQIERIKSPIGDPGLGKHPQAIALGVATELLSKSTTQVDKMGQTA